MLKRLTSDGVSLFFYCAFVTLIFSGNSIQFRYFLITPSHLDLQLSLQIRLI